MDLAALPFFRPFPRDSLAGLAATARWHRYAAGQTIIEVGEAGRDVFLVAEGTLRIATGSSGGHDMILGEIGPGALFGEISAIDGAGRSAGVVALTKARVCVLPSDAFLAFALATPAASLQLMRTLAALVREKDARLLELGALPVRPRLVALLLRLARQRASGGKIVSPPRPHHELAARIGTRREVVSRNMSALLSEGLVEQTRGGLVLPRPEALENELDAAWGAALQR